VVKQAIGTSDKIIRKEKVSSYCSKGNLRAKRKNNPEPIPWPHSFWFISSSLVRGD
jgi:hypothetical protein